MMGIATYSHIFLGFQTVENQRVERNLKRLEYALSDKLKQLETKLSDWAIWDDTYEFVENKSQEYIDSNLNQESFIKLGVDEVLFINGQGALVKGFHVKREGALGNNSSDLYSLFATGSALTKQNGSEGIHRNGIVNTSNGLYLFSVEGITKSDGSGPIRGAMVFATHFDSRAITSIADLTQSNVVFAPWNGNIPADFRQIKSKYSQVDQTYVQILNKDIISGYMVFTDIFNTPQGILRIDSERDITTQGVRSVYILMGILVISGFLGAAVNYNLMNSTVLKGIIDIAREMKDLGKTKSLSRRLSEDTGNNELTSFRKNINEMLKDIEHSQQQLAEEVETKESLIELIDSIVVMLDEHACVIMINKRGCEILGLTKEEIVGRNWIETVIPVEEQPTLKRKFSEIILANTSKNTYLESTLITKDKKILMYGWHNTVIRDAKGAVISTLSLGNDISEKKKEERALADQTNNLKRMNEIMVGRELKMIALKEEIDRLKKEINKK